MCLAFTYFSVIIVQIYCQTGSSCNIEKSFSMELHKKQTPPQTFHRELFAIFKETILWNICEWLLLKIEISDSFVLFLNESVFRTLPNIYNWTNFARSSIMCQVLHNLLLFVQILKNAHGGVLRLVKFQASACNSNKSNSPP